VQVEIQIKRFSAAAEVARKEIAHLETLRKVEAKEQKKSVSELTQAQKEALEEEKRIRKIQEQMNANLLKQLQKIQDETVKAWNKIKGSGKARLITETVSELEKLGKELPALYADAFKSAAGQAKAAKITASTEVKPTGDEPEDSKIKKTIGTSITTLTNGLEKAVTTFVMKGKIGLEEMATMAQDLFSESFSNVTGELKTQLADVMNTTLGTD